MAISDVVAPAADEPGSYLSIGEVLSLLQQEFDDITISKIRFLESQGLTSPNRTASGYRQFYPNDVEQLRWVLIQQRDHFLPLKVIKERLDGVQSSVEVTQPNLWGESELERDDAAARAPKFTRPQSGDGEPASNGTSHRAADSTSAAMSGGPRRDAAQWLASLQETPVSARMRQTEPERTNGVDADVSAQPAESAIRYVLEDLCEMTGATAEFVEELRTYGLLVGKTVGGVTTFDVNGVAIVRAVQAFEQLGVQVRHLRLFKNAVDREAGLYEQLVVPLLKQRNPTARGRAAESVTQLMLAGEALHGVLIRQALDEFRGSP